MTDLLDGWGLTAVIFLPLVGAAVMMVIPKSEETLHKVIALVDEPGGVRRRPSRCWSTSTTTATRPLQYVQDKAWIDVINSRYIVGLDGISLPLLALTVLIVPLVIIYSWNHFPEPHNPKALPHPDPRSSRRGWSARSSPRTSSCSSSSSRSCCSRCTS